MTDYRYEIGNVQKRLKSYYMTRTLQKTTGVLPKDPGTNLSKLCPLPPVEVGYFEHQYEK